MQSIVIFASGGGSNAAAIIAYFKNSSEVQVSLIVTNKADAGVIGIAERENIPFLLVDKNTFHGALFLEQLADVKPDLLVLAGFLWKIPEPLVATYPNKIINIHPSLLPRHGGKGMYGIHVHESVLHHGDKESGITIHYVNERYDEGNVIVQAYCPVHNDDTLQLLAARVLKLEHYFYPRTIGFLLTQK